MTREEISQQAAPLLERLHKILREKAVLLKELRAVQEQCPHPVKVDDGPTEQKCPDCGKRFNLHDY